MKIKLMALGMMVVCSPSFAAELDGTWSGAVDGPSGPIEVKYQFKVDGAKLTGSTAAPDGTAIPIKEGKIDGAKIAFTVDLDLGGTAMTFNYTGVLSGVELKLHTAFMEQPFDFVVKKVVAKEAAK